MNIAFQVEGTSDEIVLPILVRRILGKEIVPAFPERRPGGCKAVLNTLASIAWHYWRQGAEGLVVCIDNDECLPLHESTHAPLTPVKGCNFCTLLTGLPKLPDRSPLPPFKFAVGVPVQALESWLLADGHLAGPPERFPPKELKRQLYGTTAPTLEHFRTICKPKAEQIDLSLLRTNCPSFAFFEKSAKAFSV